MNASPTTADVSSDLTKEQYNEWREDFRQLNTIFWRTPIIATTGIGGLWFGVATLELPIGVSIALLVFAALYACVMMAVVWRLRMKVMARLLSWLDEVEGIDPDRSSHLVAKLFMALLGTAALGSLLGVVFLLLGNCSHQKVETTSEVSMAEADQSNQEIYSILLSEILERETKIRMLEEELEEIKLTQTSGVIPSD